MTNFLLNALRIAALVLIFSNKNFAQIPNNVTQQKLYTGLGMGFEYGSLGCKIEYLPLKHIGGFIGVGYNFVSPGLNAGVSFKMLPNKKITPVIVGMYGTNASVKVDNANYLNSVSFGFTLGGGGEFKVGRNKNKIQIGIYYPIRSKSFESHYKSLQDNPNLQFDYTLLPITASFGFNFRIL